MRAALFFSLPEDQEDFDRARMGGSYRCVLDEMDNYLRKRLKYEELPKEVREALQAARDELTSLTLSYTTEDT